MPRTALRRYAQPIARYELWLMLPLTALLLFPRGITPWLGLALLALLWLARWHALGRLSVRTPLDLPIVLLLAAALVGLAISIDRTLSWPRFWSLLLGIAWYYALANHPGIEKQARQSLAALALLTIAVALLSLFGTDWSNHPLLSIPALYSRIPSLLRGLPGSGISMSGELFNPRWVGITMGFLVPVPLAAALFGKGRALRALSALAALLGIALLLLSQSIQGLLGLAVGVIVLALWRLPWFPLLLPLAAFLSLPVILIIGPLRLAETLLSIDNPIGIAVALRLDIWSRALAMITSMPFTGIGLNTFPRVLSEFFPGYLLGPEPHAHNLVLQTLLDFGLVGLFAFIWIVIAWGASLLRNYQRADGRNRQVLLVGLAAGVAAYLAHGLIDSLMLGAKPAVALWVMLGLGVGASRLQLPAESKSRLAAWRAALLRSLPLLLLAFTLLWVGFRSPLALNTNLGLLYAQHALLQPNGDSPDRTWLAAHAYLLKSYQRDPHNRYVAETLGRIYAWEGRNRLALKAFNRRVALDMQDPFRHYYPPIYLQRLLRAESPPPQEYAADLLRIYTHWANRYPTHAEHLLRLAITWQLSDPASTRPTQLLQQGIQNNAQPLSLLQAYLDSPPTNLLLSQSNPVK